jgi:two-component system chemotaxis response regulator CheY
MSKSKSILIVDDSPSLLQMVEAKLKSANYLVTKAEDGQVVLDICANKRFDYVLNDLNMPRMDGITLVKSLRAKPTFAATAIVVLTTEASNVIKALGRAAGATGWMVKPFDPRKLLQDVAKVIG